MYSLESRKARFRQQVSKKYNQLYSKISLNQDKSIESKLRILRSYRIRLLHEFCRDVLQDAYQDSVTAQALLACQELRVKSLLFPNESDLFTLNFNVI